MIVSLTPNTTLDLTVFVPQLVTNTTIRASRTVHSMGGKPTDAAWILGRMGVGSLALGLAAGAVGEKVKSMLEELGVTTDFIAVGGETRINTVIIDESSGEHTTITSASMQVAARTCESLAQALRRRPASRVSRHHRRFAATGHGTGFLRRRDSTWRANTMCR